MFRQSPQAAAARLEQLAAEFLAGPANDLEMAGGREPAFGPALFGYAAGDDPVWLDFKEAVAPRYWSPKEAFEKTFPGQAAVAGDLSVVAWALPQTEATLRDQRAAKEFACERWVHSRYLSQPRVVDGLARFLLDHLGREGVAAVSPDHLPDFTHWPSDRFTITSPWSQRHAAFAAGLGTFGLCDGLITPVGKAVRFGSLVVKMKLPVTPRPYTDHRQYCLFFNSGTCGQCIKRCPAGAVSRAGHDKNLCRPYAFDVNMAHIKATWPELSGAYACGLCQANVPCEKGIPPQPKRAGK